MFYILHWELSNVTVNIATVSADMNPQTRWAGRNEMHSLGKCASHIISTWTRKNNCGLRLTARRFFELFLKYSCLETGCRVWVWRGSPLLAKVFVSLAGTFPDLTLGKILPEQTASTRVAELEISLRGKLMGGKRKPEESTSRGKSEADSMNGLWFQVPNFPSWGNLSSDLLPFWTLLSLETILSQSSFSSGTDLVETLYRSSSAPREKQAPSQYLLLPIHPSDPYQS